MSLVSIPFTFSAGAVIVASQHNSCFSTIYSDYNGNIDNTNIAANAGIVASKLDLTSPGAIGSTAANTGKFTNLNATGTINLGTTHQGDVLYDNGTNIVRLTPGTAGQFLQTQGASANPQWANGTGLQIFTASGTFTAPAGVTKVFLSMVGGGAGGGTAATDANSGGGSAGSYIVGFPYTVTPAGNYTVTIGAGGGSASNGNATVFDLYSVPGGNAGSTVGGISSASIGTAGVYVYSAGGTGGVTGDGGAGGSSPFGLGAAVSGHHVTPGTSAAANTGGGGSGNSFNSSPVGGSGGSGICIVRW